MKWSGLKVVFAGRFKRWTLHELSDKLTGFGAHVSRNVTSRTDYLIVGRAGGSRTDRAETFGVRILSEDVLVDLLSGRLDEPPPPEAPPERPTDAINDVLGGLRDTLYQDPSPRAWEKVCALLDRCEEDHLPLALDYLEHGDAAWAGHMAMPLAYDVPLGDEKLDEGEFAQHRRGAREGVERRAIPKAWQKEVLKARVDNPRFSALRVLGFETKATTTTARNILKCQHFTHVRAIFMGYWATDKLARDLGAFEGLPALTHIHIQNGRVEHRGLQALCDLKGLRHLSMELMWYESRDPLRLGPDMKSLALGAFIGDMTRETLSTTEARLKRLRLNSEDPLSVDALYRLPALAELECLDVGQCGANPSRALLRAPFLETLRGLDLSHSNCDLRDIEALASCARLTGLERLIIDERHGNKASRAICDSPVFSDALKAPFRARWRA